jgi:hypothetical protein
VCLAPAGGGPVVVLSAANAEIVVTNLRLVSITSFQARAERQRRQKDIIIDLLKATHDEPGSAGATYQIFNAADDAQRCMSNPAVREAISTRLTACGYPPAMLLAQAHINSARHINAIDRRIASYEVPPHDDYWMKECCERRRSDVGGRQAVVTPRCAMALPST